MPDSVYVLIQVCTPLLLTGWSWISDGLHCFYSHNVRLLPSQPLLQVKLPSLWYWLGRRFHCTWRGWGVTALKCREFKPLGPTLPQWRKWRGQGWLMNPFFLFPHSRKLFWEAIISMAFLKIPYNQPDLHKALASAVPCTLALGSLCPAPGLFPPNLCFSRITCLVKC